MDNEEITNKAMKVEISSETEMLSGGIEFSSVAPTSGPGVTVLTRQASAAKSNCLCSPTTHAGSFRCRLHRSPSLQRTKSMESASHRDSTSKANTTSADTTNNANTVEAQ